MRRLLFLLGLLAFPTLAQAQIGQYVSVLRYDLASTDPISCSGGPDWVQGLSTVSTSGSSTTLTAATAGSFDPVSAGDAILVNGNFRMVASKASSTSLTLSSAINQTATGWRYIHFTCGTGANDGAFTVSNWGQATVSVDITTMTATSIEARLRCRNQTPDSNWNTVYPTAGNNECGAGTEASGYCSFTAAATLDIVIDEPHGQCRVELKVTSDTAGAESINVSAIGSTRPR